MLDDDALVTTSGVVQMSIEERQRPVSPSGVALWRKQGLLRAAERTSGGVFLYRARDVRRLFDRLRERSDAADHTAA